MIEMDHFDDFLIKTKVRDLIVCRVLDGDQDYVFCPYS